MFNSVFFLDKVFTCNNLHNITKDQSIYKAAGYKGKMVSQALKNKLEVLFKRCVKCLENFKVRSEKA